jgi:mannose-6-phosphate isomerase-like protein (cupin superfamily)
VQAIDNATSAYQRAIARESVPIHEGYGVPDVTAVPRAAWPRLGGAGAFIQLAGTLEAEVGIYVVEIPGGGALNPDKHMYEKVLYVLRGRGLTQVWQRDERERQVFEWGEGSLFAIPLNASHRLINGGGEPALLMAVTNAPLMMNLFHNDDFIHNCDYRFGDRYAGDPGYFADEGKRYKIGQKNMWETNLIPDIRRAALDAKEVKGAGAQITQFEMTGNLLIGHITDWPSGVYHKAHYHGPGAVLLGLRSKGYVLMWPRDLGLRPYQDGHADRVVRLEWGLNSIYSPPDGWFHQHFNTGPEPGRHLAIRYGSWLHGGLYLLANAGAQAVVTSIRKGGTMIEYEDEDPQIRKDFDASLRREGVASQMPEVVYR